jgi:hypothetical protein
VSGDDRAGAGLVTAVELVQRHRRGEDLVLVGEQLPLIPTAGARAPDAEQDPPAPGARGPGRPPGARNKRTAEWVEFILSRYRSPLLALAEIYSRPVDVLTQELGCTRLEAFQEQRRAAEALLPYLHQKQPLAVQVDSRGVVQLVLVDGNQGEAPIAEDGLVLDGKLVDPPADGENEADQ